MRCLSRVRHHGSLLLRRAAQVMSLPQLAHDHATGRQSANLFGNLRHQQLPLTACRVLLLALAEWVCGEWQRDAKAARLVQEMRLFIVPTMNPDGFEARTRENRWGPGHLFSRVGPGLMQFWLRDTPDGQQGQSLRQPSSSFPSLSSVCMFRGRHLDADSAEMSLPDRSGQFWHAGLPACSMCVPKN